MSEIDQDAAFSPLAAFQQALRFWWFLSALMLLGGLIGLAMNALRPTVYEAVASFSASIDYVATGPLTQYEEDTAFNAIGEIISSDAVTQRVIGQAAAQGVTLTRAGLMNQAVLERKVTVWELRVRDTDPARAVRIAGWWAEQGQAVLQDSYRHALQAAQWERATRALESCLAQTAATVPQDVPCARAHFAEIQADLQSAGKTLTAERLASRGLFSGLTLAPASPAVLAARPVLFQRAQMTLAGGVLGLLLGVVLLWLGLQPSLWRSLRPIFLARWFGRKR